MPKLGEYAESVYYAVGLTHMRQLNALRQYLKVTPESQLIKEIKAIRNPDYLRSLWEAGLRQPLQEAVMAKLEELT